MTIPQALTLAQAVSDHLKQKQAAMQPAVGKVLSIRAINAR